MLQSDIVGKYLCLESQVSILDSYVTLRYPTERKEKWNGKELR